MPTSIQDARTVEEHIDRIFSADGSRARAEAIRRLFVEVLDFHGAAGQVSLADAKNGAELPALAERIASLDGVHVLWVALATKRVNKREAAAAAGLIEQDLGEDLLLVCTNLDENHGDADQLHLILPDFGSGTTPTLRRMTIERHLPQRTAFEQIAGIYRAGAGPVRQALAKAFEVEPVTKRFFAEYDRIFKAAKALVTGFDPERENGDTLEERQKAADEKRHLFVQTLFNRLLFVHFLSRKGWLSFNDDNRYLRALWGDYRSEPGETNFHRDRLRRLFFDGLSNPESQFREYPDIGKVQFLNGGLFEETDLDRHADVTVPDEAIEPLLFELFDRFNFTVMESTPFDIEVAVDPEMLGKVFEELVTGRHESGSYYTPRPVVSFMCREALKGYLEGCETGLDPEAIRKFVDEHDESGIPHTGARAVGEALDEVTAVDPACGSGAYLLGMMQELIELWSVLYSDKLKTDARGFYELKLHIIERNLHGVDIDPFAANIAMLRLWLSLAVEYEGEPPIPPLPNLDFKIVCGDSLLGPDPSGLSLDRVTIEKSGLGQLKAAYLRESDGDAKKRLRGEIDAAASRVRSGLGGTAVPDKVVDWRVEFAEVFAPRGGFDIAIANPPYERQEQISAEKQSLERLYPDVYAGRADYLVYFYERAVQSLRPGGVLSFITSNKYMRAGYGRKLRKYLAAHLSLSQLVDFADLPVFAATAYPSVLVGRKTDPIGGHQLQVADLGQPIRHRLDGEGLPVVTETVNRVIDRLPALLTEHGIQDYPQTMLRDEGWVLNDPNFVQLFERLLSRGTTLGDFVDGRIYMGVKTGLNKAFVVSRAKRDELVDADPRSAELLKPWLRGKDVQQWRATSADLFIIFTSRGVDIRRYPAIEEHLQGFRRGLEGRATAHLHPWYEHQQPQEGIYAEFEQPKIVWPDITPDMRFALDQDASYLDMTCFTIPTRSHWLLAVLNSGLTEFLLCQLTSSLRGGYLRPKRQYMTRLPIVAPDAGFQQSLDGVAEAGIASEPVDMEALNELVYDLYGLSRADRALIREWFERRSLTA